eukprot:TRINITY_DN6323_c0_g1_i6.p3 TRINITY_DN6323_c0_g1~~TRINITY_DN6323_c0_g1_i6.p3  ORF type:complete len:141 (+),score=1.10 TRINITY_DN6323_c0_g1_i6:874-1296(+)
MYDTRENGLSYVPNTSLIKKMVAILERVEIFRQILIQKSWSKPQISDAIRLTVNFALIKKDSFQPASFHVTRFFFRNFQLINDWEHILACVIIVKVTARNFRCQKMLAFLKFFWNAIKCYKIRFLLPFLLKYINKQQCPS